MPVHKKNLPILSLLTLVFLCVPAFAFAQGTIESTLWHLVNAVFGFFMGLAGLLLNFAVADFVVGFGKQFLTSGVGIVVNTLWVNVRDIFNITFIFGLVYIGFKMILNSEDSNTRRWLVNLILAALLVNFSLFITKFIVDFTNILATQIVNGGFGGSNISNFFMDSLGLTTLWSGLPPNASYGYIFGAAMVFIVATFVFAAGGIMLIIRYASLCLYMVMSPLMFLGWVFPGMQSVTTKYWSGFLGRAFFAPVYLLLLFFAASIVKQFYGSGQQKVNFTELFNGNGNNIASNVGATLAPFILTCIFLIAAVVVANKLSADGASTMIKAGNNLKGRAQRGLQRGAMGGARLAVAPAAKGAGWVGRKGSYALGSSLDRNINRMQKSNSKAVRWAANSVVADDALRGSAAKLKGNKFGLKYTVDEANKRQATIDNRYANHQALEAGLAAQQTNNSYDRGTHAIMPGTGEVVERDKVTNQETMKQIETAEQERDKLVAAAQTKINDLSQKELEEMFASDKVMFTNVIGKVKDSQFDKVMDSDALTAEDKNSLLAVRQQAIKGTYEKNGTILSENLQNLSIKQIEKMGDDFIRDNAALLSKSQMDSVIKSEAFTEGQKGAYIGARKNTQIKMASSKDERAQLFGHNDSKNTNSYSKPKKAVEIANLPFEVFMNNEETLKEVTPGVLEAIVKNDTMNADQRAQLKSRIQGSTSGLKQAKDYMDSAQGMRHWG